MFKKKHLIFLTLLLLILAFPIIKNIFKIKELSSKLEKLENRNFSIDAKVDFNPNKQKELETKIKFLKEKNSKRKELINILNFIEKKVLKSNVKITKLDINESKIFIYGVAEDTKKILTFVNYLKKSSYFKNTKINKIYNTNNQNYFTIVAILKNHTLES